MSRGREGPCREEGGEGERRREEKGGKKKRLLLWALKGLPGEEG